METLFITPLLIAAASYLSKAMVLVHLIGHIIK